ncbi:hypothetical protein LL999_20660 [Burkholderia ambifaria]|uniref:hypothetical protein n=1 Tax=Burkholderia ambifaria TaxID=152480 RepID=UPI001E43E724|nr:hypothetical protein [Burkholderia ambifaria]UEP25029.1 hypothetical protein LL999_20660 [Burkholderia ambifaria]
MTSGKKARAFERAVFNVAFTTATIIPRTSRYIMARSGEWKLAPAYDVTFCEGDRAVLSPDVNVMGEALQIDRAALLRAWQKEAENFPRGRPAT